MFSAAEFQAFGNRMHPLFGGKSKLTGNYNTMNERLQRDM